MFNALRSSAVDNMYIHMHNNVALIYLDKKCDMTFAR